MTDLNARICHFRNGLKDVEIRICKCEKDLADAVRGSQNKFVSSAVPLQGFHKVFDQYHLLVEMSRKKNHETNSKTYQVQHKQLFSL